MITVIGIRFRTAGKVYYFDPEDNNYVQGEHVIVETARGIEYGEVIQGNRDLNDEEVVYPLKKVIRKATEEDSKKVAENKVKEKEAFFTCKQKILKHNLNMKLIDVEYTFDNNKILFYFTSDERVDFRELVKDLAAVFRTRIELRQIGVRDETKMCGGIGICGRGLCCNKFLSDFQPVSIKMAKDQSLSLNPIKISGICGRLMCCLKYEEDVYVEIRGRLPEVGDMVETPDG
ncbi:MAG: stage 0 sporulation family protein, partial [Cellulosilyticaceae bacterium]